MRDPIEIRADIRNTNAKLAMLQEELDRATSFDNVRAEPGLKFRFDGEKRMVVAPAITWTKDFNEKPFLVISLEVGSEGRVQGTIPNGATMGAYAPGITNRQERIKEGW